MSTPRERLRDLSLAKAQQDKMLDDAHRLDRRIGQLAAQAITADEYTTEASVGRALGISPEDVGGLVAAAGNSGPSRRAQPRIPVLDNTLAGDYVCARGARIVRSISGFDEGDVLFQSVGLDPALFADPGDAGGRISVPNMVWQLDSGHWVGVSMATVGYGGTGCGFSMQALMHAGVDEQAAAEIVRSRFCDAVDVDDVSSWHTSTIWPVHARSFPWMVADRMIVNFGPGLRLFEDGSLSAGPVLPTPDVDPSGFLPSKTAQTPYEAWLGFLDQDLAALPEWAQGRRVARVFLDEAAAHGQGFVLSRQHDFGEEVQSRPMVVIEQGRVQLWGHFDPSEDNAQALPAEAYEALGLAGVYPAGLAGSDARSAHLLSRLSRAVLGTKRDLPSWIDVSSGGGDVVQFVPVESGSKGTDQS